MQQQHSNNKYVNPKILKQGDLVIWFGKQGDHRHNQKCNIIFKNVKIFFCCLSSVHNITGLSRHEQENLK